jgi:hypothetical protein
MTKEEAYDMLGISEYDGPEQSEQAYRQKQKQLQLRLFPGNSAEERKKTQAEIIMLMNARDIVCSSPAPWKPHRPKKQKQKPQQARQKPAVSIPDKPETLAEAWGQFLDLMPLPQTISAALVCMVLVILILRFFFLRLVILLTVMAFFGTAVRSFFRMP